VNKVYVADNYGGKVTVIDGLTNDTVSVQAGLNPVNVAVNPAMNRLEIHVDVYAVNRDAGGQNVLEVCIPWLIKPIDKESHDRLRMG